MKNNFQTITKGNDTLKVGDVIFGAYYGTVRHANSINKQELHPNTGGIEMEPSSDWDLLKLWSHSTIKRKHGVYASKLLLQKELESRGYILTNNKHRWKKAELVA